MQYFKISLIVLILSYSGCEYRAQRAREEKRVGINGKAIYVYKKDDQLWGVYKPEYNIHDYQIFINSDSIKVGDIFRSSIWVTSPKFLITISSPSDYIIEGDSTYDPKEYIFQPQRKGIYEFRGVIEYDSVKRPFEYKFFVE
jgi:hypothetical protein